jgi:NADPH:quinone reductase-like Zn-dependent oxidoreductase
MMNRAKSVGARAVVQTAAASALGQMMEGLGRRFRIPVINVVRRAEQVDLLRSKGAEHVLDSGAEDFDERLGKLCKELRATVGFDAVAGEMTGRILGAMPVGSRIIVYGALSGGGCLVDPRSLIFEDKHVEGFWLSKWLRSQNILKMLRTTRRVQKLLAGDLRTEIRARLSLEEAVEGIRQYSEHMTGGKILLIPGLKKQA